MKCWSFYHAATGLFSGRRYSGPEAQLLANTPQGLVAIDGVFDRNTHRFDLSTGEVIVDESLGAERDQERRRGATLQQIAALELRQLRPLRELAVDPGNVEAAQRLAEIEQEIAELRAAL